MAVNVRMEIDHLAVHQICAGHQIVINDLRSTTGSFGKKIFFINHELLLRVSKRSMALEQEKFRRVAGLDHVPKMVHTGTLERAAGPLYYTLLTMLPGADLESAFPETTPAQQKQLGEDLAGFLDRLQGMGGTQYAIGVYVPALAGFCGTWRAGHQEYWELLRQGCEKLPLQPGSRHVFDRAFRFLQACGAALDFQSGPKLLHNDLHPRNILLDRGKFSGVIDWECSQYGEADFELCHFIHWCLYPPKPGQDLRTILRALWAAAPQCTRVPALARRLTIYQIEHELQQLIWSAGQAESWRVPRLEGWMRRDVKDLLAEIGG